MLSCGETLEKPQDMLPEDTMTNILLDIHLTEARIGRTILHQDTAKATFRFASKDILKKHGVSDSAFRHSYDFYLKHPAEMDKLYERIIDSLSLQESKLMPKDGSVTPAPPTPTLSRPALLP
ncbi:DUF4296 domain-containing protein [Rufibacter sp. LB8]